MVTYRKIQSKDAALLRALAQSCPPLDVHTHYTYWVVAHFFGEYGYIAEDNGKPIGYIMTVETKECIFVWQIGVIDEYKGKKISSGLIENVAADAAQKGVYLEVSIADDNIPSFSTFSNFCRKNGYTMEKIGVIDLSDLADESFSEIESHYRITPKNE